MFLRSVFSPRQVEHEEESRKPHDDEVENHRDED